MTKKLFRNTVLFLTFVLGGIFLNSCSDLNNLSKTDNVGMINFSKTATVGFSISNTDARTALPNQDDHDLKKYLYLYNYTLTYVDENGNDQPGEEKIICNDFSWDKFCKESTVRLAMGKKYRFTLKAKDGDVTRMEGSSIITLTYQPTQTVTIVLMPAGEEYGQKLRVDWIVPDDGVITTMKAGISPERGHAESQSESEILVPKYKFQEYSFSVIDNPFEEGDEHKTQYGATVKRIGVTYDDVKTGVARWLDYKFYDANGILVYESSESVYMIGGKTSSAVIYITPDHYYRRPVTITVKKDNNPWKNNEELELKLVDNDNEYIFKPVLDGDGNPTGEFKGLLPGESSGDGTASTDGVFDIYVAVDGIDDSKEEVFIKTGAEYDANSGTITGNGSTPSVELVTVPVPQKGVTLTPTDGVVSVDGTVGDKAGNGGLIVPKGQDFTVKVELELGYRADGPITIGGKTVGDDGKVTLNADDDLSNVGGVSAIEYTIVYKSDDSVIGWQTDYTPTDTFYIESADIELPKEENFAAGFTKGDKKIGGWWFASEENIIHKINAEKAVKEKLIRSANADNEVVLNVYWIPVTDVEYKLVYEFEDLGSDPVTYSEDKNIISFHNVSVPRDQNTEVEIPQIPGFTAVEIVTGESSIKPAKGFTTITLDGEPDAEKEYITKEIHYERNEVTITLWTDSDTVFKSFSGKYGEAHDHVDDPVLVDHRFLGWYVKGDEQTPIKHVDDHRFPAESVEYVAKWEQTHANYTVEFYYENVGSGYTKTSTHTVKGAVGSFPAFNTTPQTGFTYNDQKRSITSGGVNVNVVKADGSTLVKLYFDRKTITFTLKSNGGKFTDGRGNTTEEIILEGKFGAALPSADSRRFKVGVPQPQVLEGIKDSSAMADDFEFIGWHVRTEEDLEAALPSTFPEENKIYAARWKKINSTYKVVHWAESMDKYEEEGIYKGQYKLLAPKAIDGFTGQMLEGSVTKKGKIGSPMVYYLDSVKGFEAPTVEIMNSDVSVTGQVAPEVITAEAKKITADGKTEVIVTYLRKEYTITFHLNAGGDTNAKWVSPDAGAGSAETVTRTGKYRIDFTPPANPVREHFVFRGWTTKENGTLEDRVDVVPSYTEEAPKDYYAVWYSKASGGLETDTADISLSCTPTAGKITANVVIPVISDGWTYRWSVNNVPVPSVEMPDAVLRDGGKELTLSNCLQKSYEITVVATLNGKVYTKTEVVTGR